MGWVSFNEDIIERFSERHNEGRCNASGVRRATADLRPSVRRRYTSRRPTAACEICGARVRRMRKHMRKVHAVDVHLHQTNVPQPVLAKQATGQARVVHAQRANITQDLRKGQAQPDQHSAPLWRLAELWVNGAGSATYTKDISDAISRALGKKRSLPGSERLVAVHSLRRYFPAGVALNNATWRKAERIVGIVKKAKREGRLCRIGTSKVNPDVFAVRAARAIDEPGWTETFDLPNAQPKPTRN